MTRYKLADACLKVDKQGYTNNFEPEEEKHFSYPCNICKHNESDATKGPCRWCVHYNA